MEGTTKPFIAAMKEFFGFRPGESLTDFKKEMDALTEKDRKDYYDMLLGIGYTLSAYRPKGT